MIASDCFDAASAHSNSVRGQRGKVTLLNVISHMFLLIRITSHSLLAIHVAQPNFNVQNINICPVWWLRNKCVCAQFIEEAWHCRIRNSIFNGNAESSAKSSTVGTIHVHCTYTNNYVTSLGHQCRSFRFAFPCLVLPPRCRMREMKKKDLANQKWICQVCNLFVNFHVYCLL